MRLLTDGRCSLEDERTVVELSRGSALSRDPEPVNPKVGTSEHQVPFSDSDEVRSGDGGPK
jgi:hypothetical protein